MKTYVLGAGASLHAGYPLGGPLGTKLFEWMKEHETPVYDYPQTADFFETEFGPSSDFEELLTNIQELIKAYEHGNSEQRLFRSIVGNRLPALTQATREWFAEIRSARAEAYEQFASEIVQPGDTIISFNYDVSLERELARAGKWCIGDGYGFSILEFPGNSPVRILKLHGSVSWLAVLFGGLTSGPAFFQPDNVFGVRPVFPSDELRFLGYPDLIDPEFKKPAAAVPAMIMPTRSKEFFFDTNLGKHWEWFWNQLWKQAALVLKESEEVTICGFSLLPADRRARQLLLESSNKDTRVFIANGTDTERIVQEFRDVGYHKASAAPEVFFENWVARQCINATK